MAYPPTLADLQNDVLSRLSETDDSPAGDYLPGDNSGAIITTKDTIAQYVNEASAELARTCYPIADVGSYALPMGAQTAPYTVFVCASGHTLWSARRVVWNGVELAYYARSAFEFWYPNAETDPNGTPILWYRQGHDGIGLYPRPATTQTTTVYGLAIPKQLVNGTDVATWFQPDILKLPVMQAASRLAERNNQNPALIARAAEWAQEFEQGRDDLLTRLWQTDPSLARFHYAPPAGG